MPRFGGIRSWAMGAVMSLASLGPAMAQEVDIFTIGTGSTALTYFPVGGMIANAISRPPGSLPCAEGGSCGVEGIVASAVSSRGSVENIEAIMSGQWDSGFAQSDVAFLAHIGEGLTAAPATDLRTIAALYPEDVHLVVRADSPVTQVADLAGRVVSVDEQGSGTYVAANMILQAADLGLDRVEARQLDGATAAAALRAGEIDAFFAVAGYPTRAVEDLAEEMAIRILPITGQVAAQLTDQHGFFAPSMIPEGTYVGVGEIETISAGAQWFTSATADEDLIFEITRALWNAQTRKLLDEGHARGRSITLETALDGVGVPLHDGAMRFYRESGILDR